MKKYTFWFLAFNLAINLFILSSCKNRKLNYITYYNKVNRIDSMYRFQKDTLAVIRQYRKLFRKYPPRNQERIEEYATYIKLSDLRHKRFGGQKSLYKLLPLVAQHNKNYKKLLGLYQKYGIDSLSV